MLSRLRISRRPAWAALACAAVVVAVTSFVASSPSKEPDAVILSSMTAPTHPQSTGSRQLAVPPSLVIPVSHPLSLAIPAINVRTNVGSLGLQPDGQIMVPTTAHSVDWYRDGPTPGTVGSAVFLGHVDSYLGPGTFFDLKLLKAGDAIIVTLVDGTVEHFKVSAVVQYAKAVFPDKLVYGSHGTRSLQLVTCGGSFDHSTGHYEANVVVFSRLISATVPKRDAAT
jgi:hypothetical protein